MVLCEVLDSSGKPHPTNARNQLKEVIDASVEQEDPWFGFEQEYTMFGKNGRVYDVRCPISYIQNWK